MNAPTLRQSRLRCVTLTAWLICLLVCSQSSLRAGGPLASCDEIGLRAALVGGGTVTFVCDGTITLANTLVITNDTVLDASGHSVTLSGNKAVRILNVTNASTLTIKNLTLSRGLALGTNGSPGVFGGPPGADGSSGFGGAVLVSGGTLNLLDCQIGTNNAIGGSGGNGGNDRSPDILSGKGGDAAGGAIYVDGGSLNATNTDFFGNWAMGGFAGTNTSLQHDFNDHTQTGGSGLGGAVYGRNSQLNFDQCSFLTNYSRGAGPATYVASFGGYSGASSGGVICGDTVTSTITNCYFYLNSAALLYNGSVGSSSYIRPTSGGVVYNTNGTFNIYQSTFISNNVTSSYTTHPNPGQGGAVCNVGQMSVEGCRFICNSAEGGGGSLGTNALGGAIMNGGTLTVDKSLFTDNFAAGGYYNGSGLGGAIHNKNVLVVENSTFFRNKAVRHLSQTESQAESPSFGGALFTRNSCFLTNVTIVGNIAEVTVPTFAPSDPNDAFGGGICCADGTLVLVHVTLAQNAAIGGVGGIGGLSYGGNIYTSNATVTLYNTIVANGTSNNAYGPIVDGGHNISSDASCAFTQLTSLNNTDPKLGPLDDYGGPTPTVPLLTGSPAIDAGFEAVLTPTDQRGHARPYNFISDIGAFESSPPYVVRGYIRDILPEEITVGNGSVSTLTTNHAYSLTGLTAGSHTITPAGTPSSLIVPANRVVSLGPDQLNVNFKAYQRDTLTVENYSNNVMQLIYTGTNGDIHRVLGSSDLVNWIPLSTNTVGPSNQFDFFTVNAGQNARFFKTARP